MSPFDSFKDLMSVDDKPLEIDVTDDLAFRTSVVQHLQFIVDKCADLPELKRKVERHDRIVSVGKYILVPTIGVFNLSMRHILSKFGW